MIEVADFGQLVTCSLDRLRALLRSPDEESTCTSEERLRSHGVRFRRKLDCSLEVAGCGAEGIDLECTLARAKQRELCLVDQPLVAPAGSELERLSVVVRERFRVVAGAAKRLDPHCGASMLLRATRAWDLRVCDVADEDVAEGILALVFD